MSCGELAGGGCRLRHSADGGERLLSGAPCLSRPGPLAPPAPEPSRGGGEPLPRPGRERRRQAPGTAAAGGAGSAGGRGAGAGEECCPGRLGGVRGAHEGSLAAIGAQAASLRGRGQQACGALRDRLPAAALPVRSPESRFRKAHNGSRHSAGQAGMDCGKPSLSSRERCSAAMGPRAREETERCGLCLGQWSCCGGGGGVPEQLWAGCGRQNCFLREWSGLPREVLEPPPPDPGKALGDVV